LKGTWALYSGFDAFRDFFDMPIPIWGTVYNGFIEPKKEKKESKLDIGVVTMD